jgi:valyl-tRNA synthetase
MRDLPKAYIPKEVEEKWYSFWKKGGFFHADPVSSKKGFSIVMPPPNVTGVLHMGHALDDTIQDILIRYKRMRGYETLWVPGTDHAGIATQTVVEKHLLATRGKKRRDFSRDEFLSLTWKWKEEKQGQILSQIQKLGASCDWDRLRFTMDEKSNKAVRTIFKRLFDDGLIYRGDYLVNWDPITKTALSDDEVEHEERDSHLWYFRYPIIGQEAFLVVATTRPETMLGDTAVAVSPKDPRYAAFIGKEILLPLTQRRIPIIADPEVDPAFGSGAVKITPAHDFNDYEMASRHSLPLINIMTPDGHVNEEGKEFCGMSFAEARVAIVQKMKDLHLLEKIEPYRLRVGVSYRSKAVIEPFLSKQWFVKMTAFKKTLIDSVKSKKVALIPSYWEETYFYWIENIRDWCISRQIWWGHRIPVWYSKKDASKMICSDGEDLPKEVKKNPDDWRQDEDVLDTWFSSALWPFSTLGWPDKTQELKKFYPTSVLVTGHDILFFWVARMILMGEYALKKVPFHKVFIHGLIYGKSYWRQDPDGSATYLSSEEKKRYDLGEAIPSGIYYRWEKMSKSKGNVIDPIEIIEDYGTDAMRLALSHSLTHARQIDLDLRRFEEHKNFANKIWNGARFILMNITSSENPSLPPLSKEAFAQGIDPSLLTLDDRWILSISSRMIQEINQCFEDFTFDRAVQISYDFFWNDFCSHYLELVKPYLFGKVGTTHERTNKQKLVLILLSNYLRCLHPIAPFITEEIFSLLKEHFSNVEPDKKADTHTKDTLLSLSANSLMIAPYPQLSSKKEIAPKVEESFALLLKIVHAIRNIRAEMQIPLGEKSDVILFGKAKDSLFALAQKEEPLIAALVKINKIQFTHDPNLIPEHGAIALIDSLKIYLPLSQDLLMKEKERLLKEKEKVQKALLASSQKLSTKDFVDRAPAAIVQKEREQLQMLEEKMRELQKKLSPS